MRRIVAFDRVSADGYFSAAGGDLSWSVPEPAFDQEVGKGMGEGAGTLLFGRRTFDMFESFWPNVLKADGNVPDPHAPGRENPGMRAMAEWLDGAEKLVFSRTRDGAAWRNTRFLGELTPGAVEALKREPGRDIMIFGSGSVVSQLSDHGLVDEYWLLVTPVLLGGGRSLVEGLSRRVRLSLVEAKPYPEGNVGLRYAPAPNA
jgi:dihydrofolate reductase